MLCDHGSGNFEGVQDSKINNYLLFETSRLLSDEKVTSCEIKFRDRCISDQQAAKHLTEQKWSSALAVQWFHQSNLWGNVWSFSPYWIVLLVTEQLTLNFSNFLSVNEHPSNINTWNRPLFCFNTCASKMFLYPILFRCPLAFGCTAKFVILANLV